MQCVVAGSARLDPREAGEDLAAALEAELSGAAPSLLVVHGRADVLAPALLDALRARFPAAAVFGGSSCQGALWSGPVDARAAVALGIVDPRGAYGVAGRPLGHEPRAAGRAAAQAALDDARRTYEVPALVLVAQAPGHEEEVLAGIADIVGEAVPVLGGSTADDAVAGQWRELATDGVRTSSVSVAVLFPSVEVGFAFQSGYDPTDAVGLVTAREGRRLERIEDEPAAQWYHRVTGGQVFADPYAEMNVLGASTFFPLGRERGHVDQVSTYLLVHPERVHADGSLTVFATVEAGETLRLMNGTLESLTTRATRVARDALTVAGLEPDQVAGALVIYCGGCMLAVGERLPEVLEGLRQVLPGVPFAGAFTFGEAGWLVDRSHHGNLMISVVVFAAE